MGKWAVKDTSKKEQTNLEDSWANKEVFAILTIIFLVIELIGVFVAISLFNQGLQDAPFGEGVNDPINAIGLFVMILIMTGLLLLIIKLKREKKFLIIIETIAIFSTSILLLQAIIPNKDAVILLISLLIVVMRNIDRENIFMRNIASAVAIIGAGALLGISIGLAPLLLFITILAIYDIVAVFGTKHMVTLGKAVTKQNFAFTIAMPTKKHTFELGNGDLVIPLMVAASIIVNGPFIDNSFVTALSLVASFAGLCISIYLVSQKKIAMPALPPQTALMLIVILLALFFGL